VQDLGYRPRASARSLVTGATGTLALVIPFFTHPSAIERLRGVLAAVDERLVARRTTAPPRA
jgi:DNA-binding LacI/PurR family transcriptional regulator